MSEDKKTKTMQELIAEKLGDIVGKFTEKALEIAPKKDEPDTPKPTPDAEKNVDTITIVGEVVKQLVPALTGIITDEIKKSIPQPEVKDVDKVNDAVNKAMEEAGINTEELDVDIVIRKKRKGQVTDQDDTDVIFKNKHEKPADTEDDLETGDEYDDEAEMRKARAKARKLNKRLDGLDKENKQKALGIYFRKALTGK